MKESPPIVLTATITPRAPLTAYNDPSKRRREYLTALAFYRQLAPVILLENSGYDLAGDPEFTELPNVDLLALTPSSEADKGKGYQEFEMLERWLLDAGEAAPAAFLKVTGRYLYLNCAALLADAQQAGPAQLAPAQFVIDCHPRSRRALTSLFYCRSQFYREHLQGCYRDCDDQRGAWIEKVCYERLADRGFAGVRSFGVEPVLQGVSGSTGQPLRSSRWKRQLKQLCRSVNRQFDPVHLWYVR